MSKNKGGRPSKKDNIDLDMLYKLASFGLTDAQLAQAFNITEQSLNNYKKDNKFLESLKAGKQEADERVKKSLFERACGYEHEDVDIKVIQNKIVETKLIKHYPPDATSMIFWLKNRRPDEWREKHEVEHSGDLTVIIRKLSDGNNTPK